MSDSEPDDQRPNIRALLDADWAHLCTYTGAERPRRWRDSLNVRFLPVVLIRHAHNAQMRGRNLWARMFCLLLFVMFGLEYPARLRIGPGLVIFHTQGTVLGAAEIGARAAIYQQVTLGAVAPDFANDPALRPVLGTDVTVTAGAKVVGGIHIGDGATVGANAVVLADVPAGALAVGVPARILQSLEA